MTPCRETLDAMEALAQREADRGDSRPLNHFLRLRAELEKRSRMREHQDDGA